jgi:4-hydroxy-tetrahydrodipicolinate reductase
LIIATTGLSDQQLRALKKLGESVPVIQSYNFSVGIQVLIYLVDQAKNLLHNWDVEIEETHHRFKLDKPSGTSIMIKNIFKEKPVNISSLRLGNIVGDHSVHFGGLGEVITIKHSATSRRMFAQGILKAAEFSLQKEKGFFTFSDVIYSDHDFQI